MLLDVQSLEVRYGRIRAVKGVELHVDTAQLSPTVEQLLAIRDAVRSVLLNGDNA